MAQNPPSMDEWLAEAKRDDAARFCGMYLIHTGVCRATPRTQVREGAQDAGTVRYMDFSYDAEGLEKACSEALSWPGVYYVRAWLNEGRLSVGDTIMHVLVGADIRPRCISALERLVEKIKTELVEEKETISDDR